MSKFTLFEKEVNFTEAQDRYIELALMIPSLKNDARDYFQKIFDDRWSDIDDVLDEYDTVVNTLVSHLLKTGLDIFPALDSTYEVSRQKIYERKRTS